MKISKLFAITLQSKTRYIFFAVAVVYNLLLGVYLKDFLVLSPILLAFYLLTALPTLFLLVDIRSKGMRAVIFVTLFFVFIINLAYLFRCRRLILFPTMASLLIEVIYFGAFVEKTRKDSLLTKIYVLAVTVIVILNLISAYNFIYKPEAPYLDNGRDTLWDTQTIQLSDEICTDCETDAEKARAFQNWIVSNFEYDFEADPFIQYFDVSKTIRTRKGLCFDFAHLFAAFCRMTEKTKRIIEIIAAENGISPEKVEHEMMEAIRAGRASPDPHAQALWKQMCPDGKEPDLDPFSTLWQTAWI